MSNPPPPPGWDSPGGSSWPPPPPGQGGPQDPAAQGGPPPPPDQGFGPPPAPDQGFGPPPGPPGPPPPPGQNYAPPGTPPPFFPPPGQQFPPGAGPMGPPPKRGMGGGAIAAIVGGVLALVLIIAVVVVVVVVSGGKSPEEQLNAAAAKLSTARALTYKGSITSGGETLKGELTVTKGGRATGPVTWDGTNVTLLAADDKLFVKGDSSFWRDKLTSTSSPWFLSGQQWGKLDSSDLRIDYNASLAPAVLSSKLRSAARLKPKKPIKATVGGRKALKFSTGSATLYLSDSNDPELIRYESLFPNIQADVSIADSSAINTMRQTMGELSDAFDASARPSIASWNKSNCGDSSGGCAVSAKIQPPSGLTGSTEIEVRFTINGNSPTGPNLGNCTTKITVSGDSSVTAGCKVTGSAWNNWAKGAKNGTLFYKSAQYKVAGATSSDIQSMQSNLDQE
ncbi:hypothetical protein [Actinomadura atramentaria]|uniref:hypothetical protein n=1 Tax=Actinomadura atramentaria TaxID=1990 RepID=UPI00037732A8|nr:hypothetical protein [Actinomadura atramentaria]